MKSKSSASTSITRDEALSILKREGAEDRLIRHVCAVSEKAVEIARALESKGFLIDVPFVEAASILHDVGRTRTHGIRHGVEGALIMEKISPGIARVCERHIGAGIDRKEAEALGLPVKDYIPETLEEKIITHADNLIDGDRRIPIEDTIRHAEEKLGIDHPAVARIKYLSDYVEGLLK